jgi:hypothetical protein
LHNHFHESKQFPFKYHVLSILNNLITSTYDEHGLFHCVWLQRGNLNDMIYHISLLIVVTKYRLKTFRLSLAERVLGRHYLVSCMISAWLQTPFTEVYSIFNKNVRPWSHQIILFRDYEAIFNYTHSYLFSWHLLLPLNSLNLSSCLYADKIWYDLFT